MRAEDEDSGISPDCSEGVAIRLAISMFTHSASLQPAIRSSVRPRNGGLDDEQRPSGGITEQLAAMAKVSFS